MKEFTIPREVKGPVLMHGRDMGNNLATLRRLDTGFYMDVLATGIDRKGKGPAGQACRILYTHHKSAIAAEQKEEVADASSSDELISRHYDIRMKSCSACNKSGYKDFSRGDVNSNGIATITYKCIYCGNAARFNVDHSR